MKETFGWVLCALIIGFMFGWQVAGLMGAIIFWLTIRSKMSYH